MSNSSASNDSSSDGGSDGPSAADIISYIGIPLAVLGVVPIFYTFLNALITLYRVKRRLKSNQLDAITRTSLLSGIVDVEMPCYSIAPYDRDDPEYWKLSRRASDMPGGTWTVFEWNKLVTGRKLYRVQWSDELRLPPADLDFEELISFLLDRGAVPDVKGFHMLKLAGIWTPAGTIILRSPDGQEGALKITQPEDSEGILSLAMSWREEWDKRDEDSLPVGWMRLTGVRKSLEAPAATTDEKVPTVSVDSTKAEKPGLTQEDTGLTATENPDEATIQARLGALLAKDHKSDTDTGDSTAASSSPQIEKPSLEDPKAFQSEQMKKSQHSMRLLPANKDETALIRAADWEHYGRIDPSDVKSLHILDPEIGKWFAAMTIALALYKEEPLWACRVPEMVSALADKECLPCGVLVMAKIMPEEDAPEWQTKYDPNEEGNYLMRTMQESQQAWMRETRLAPAQREAARQMREAKERDDRMRRMMDRGRVEREREELRVKEAMNSTKIDTGLAATMAIEVLVKDGLVEKRTGLAGAAEAILFMMADEKDECDSVVQMLENWKTWTDRGGMKKDNYKLIMDSPRIFCYAIVLMALVKGQNAKSTSALASDMQDILKSWKRIRLG